MMTALATVSDVHPSKNGYEVKLRCEQQTSCSHCASSSSCGTGVVSKAVGNKSLSWSLETQQKLEPGQMVEIGLPEKSLLQSALIVYLFPLLMLITGTFAGEFIVSPFFHHSEPSVILTSVGFIVSGVFLSRLMSKRLEARTLNEVTLLRVLGESIL
ncbi:SoxR reducing system protein RseC [Vibrio aerogenes CECT 7868]|uniref:SoxR reducing system protein RseC n=1 Tax=Vibrio aerogenes CECT 7868 TaxID=1216006 RepID=A0A1M5YI30_9VIBR|nr:SoxR reducing system RseC family protein [Vibrio aerogenes]SHI11697.1 SoxR reducing system protein RseC [Vibrio aerogenes CECT 7868]